MTANEALEEIQENARWGRVYVTPHAQKRMNERNVLEEDLYEAIDTAHNCLSQESGTWRVEGLDCDGDELTLIIAIEGENVLVTVF